MTTRNDSRNLHKSVPDWALPYGLLAVVLVLYGLFFLALFVGDVEYGTLAEWVGAAGALVVGGLAAWFAYSAAHWAGVAARAESRNAELTERELASRVRFAVTEIVTIGSVNVGVTYIQLSTEPTSPTVWVTRIVPELRMSLTNLTEGQKREAEKSLSVTCAVTATRVAPTQIVPGNFVGLVWQHGLVEVDDLVELYSVSFLSFHLDYQVSDDPDAQTFPYSPVRAEMSAESVGLSVGDLPP